MSKTAELSKPVKRGRPISRGNLARKRKLVLPPDRADLLVRRFECRMTEEMFEGLLRLYDKGRERDLASTMRALLEEKLVEAGIVEV